MPTADPVESVGIPTARGVPDDVEPNGSESRDAVHADPLPDLPNPYPDADAHVSGTAPLHLGWLPWRWRRVVREHWRVLAEADWRTKESALRSRLEVVPGRETIVAAVRRSVETAQRYELTTDMALQLVGQALFVLALAAALGAAWWPPGPWWASLAGLGIAAVVTAGAARLFPDAGKGHAAFLGWLATILLILLCCWVVVLVPAAAMGAETGVTDPVVHRSLLVIAVAWTSFLIADRVDLLLDRVVRNVVWYRKGRRHPEETLVDNLVWLLREDRIIAETTAAELGPEPTLHPGWMERRRSSSFWYAYAVADIARTFERSWPGKTDPSNRDLESDAAEWARRVAGVLRRETAGVFVGETPIAVAADTVFDVLVGFVTRDATMFDIPAPEPSVGVSAMQRLRSAAKIVLGLAVGVAIVWGVYQPDLGLPPELRGEITKGAIGSILLPLLLLWLVPKARGERDAVLRNPIPGRR